MFYWVYLWHNTACRYFLWWFCENSLTKDSTLALSYFLMIQMNRSVNFMWLLVKGLACVCYGNGFNVNDEAMGTLKSIVSPFLIRSHYVPDPAFGGTSEFQFLFWRLSEPHIAVFWVVASRSSHSIGMPVLHFQHCLAKACRIKHPHSSPQILLG